MLTSVVSAVMHLNTMCQAGLDHAIVLRAEMYSVERGEASEKPLEANPANQVVCVMHGLRLAARLRFLLGRRA
jgi:hypothetical protein